MSKLHDFSPFLKPGWLMEPQAASFLLAQLIAGKLELDVDDTPVVYSYDDWAFFPTAQVAGTTAVMTISGTIYPYAAQYYCAVLARIFADPNISSLVIKINSPGGLGDAAYKIADCLSAAPMPILAWVDYGMAASAGYLIACACNQIMTSRPDDSVGSIGVYGTWQDWQKYYAKMGVVTRDIYAEQSTEKNSDARAAQAGNFQPIQDQMTAAAARFIDYVTAARSEKLDFSEDMDPFKGRLFTAVDALSIGLIDGIGTLQAAITSVRSLVPADSATNSTNTDDMFGFMKSTAFDAVKGMAAGDITDAQLTAINEQLAASGYENVLVVSAAQLEAATAQAVQLTTLQAQVDALTSEKATLTTTEATLTAEVARLGAQPGAMPTAVQQEAGAVEAVQTTPTIKSLLDALPHNQAADTNPLIKK